MTIVRTILQRVKLFFGKKTRHTDIQQYALTEYYIQHLYRDKTSVLTVSAMETYGEILFPSLQKIARQVIFSAQDVFVDLGSGLGKIVIQLFLNTSVKAAVGIEILPALHTQAQLAALQLRRELPDFFSDNRELNFILGDILTVPLETATIVLLTSTCFDDTVLARLGEKINKLSAIHTVLTLRPLRTLTRLRFIKTVRIECSWDTALCYVYGVIT